MNAKDIDVDRTTDLSRHESCVHAFPGHASLCTIDSVKHIYLLSMRVISALEMLLTQLVQVLE